MMWNSDGRQQGTAGQAKMDRMKEMEQAASIAVSIELAIRAEEKAKTKGNRQNLSGSDWIVMGRHNMTNRWFK